VIRRVSFLAFVGLAAAACGTTTSNGDAGASTCPATAPPDSTHCSGSIECEYPGPAAFCGDVVQCTGGTFIDSTGVCNIPLAPSCPATHAAVQIGQACTAPVFCDYADARCGCVAPVGPPLADGGGLTWQCTTTPAGCPAQHPALGTSCTSEGQTCDYGACAFSNNPYSSALAEKCTGGIWVRTFVPCPG
jgi:hypothetical protein